MLPRTPPVDSVTSESGRRGWYDGDWPIYGRYMADKASILAVLRAQPQSWLSAVIGFDEIAALYRTQRRSLVADLATDSGPG